MSYPGAPTRQVLCELHTQHQVGCFYDTTKLSGSKVEPRSFGAAASEVIGHRDRHDVCVVETLLQHIAADFLHLSRLPFPPRLSVFFPPEWKYSHALSSWTYIDQTATGLFMGQHSLLRQSRSAI